jgi:general secretion pathway protein K
MDPRRNGVVLLIVLFFALLLSASVATFLKRATIDAMLSRNRDAVARAETWARGGVELAKGLLAADKARDTADEGSERLDTNDDAWAQAREITLEDGPNATLRLTIQDDGSKLNVNSLFLAGDDGQAPVESQDFLIAFFERMIEELPVEVRALYDPRSLSENLIDFTDEDEERVSGGAESDYYRSQEPPYYAPNHPLLSVDELGLVEGFTSELIDVMRPYVTVYPFASGGGVNPNTAPPHILALIYYNDGVDYRFISDDDVRRMVDLRDGGQLFCRVQDESNCVGIEEILPNAVSIIPRLAYHSETFTVRAVATVGEVRRTAEAVIDRTTANAPLLLSWKVW